MRARVVVDFVLLLVEFVLPEEVVDGFVVLRVGGGVSVGGEEGGGDTHDFEELALHRVFPAF